MQQQTKQVSNLIAACQRFIPLDGRVLVHALKLRQVKQEDYSFDLANTKANEGKDPEKHRVDLVKVQPKVNAKYQEAIVLQIPFDENRFSVGDHVLYPIGSINPFDYVKGVSVLRKYDIAAVINESVIATFNKSQEDLDNEKGEYIFGETPQVMAGYNMA